MARLLTLVLLALLTVLEVAVVLALIDALGVVGTLLVLALDVLAGFFVVRWGIASGPPARAWRIGAGVFIALPGFVLDLVGLVLLVPGAQRWISGHVLRGTEAALRRRGVSVVTVTDADGSPRTTVVPGDVVVGDVVDQDTTEAGDPDAADPNAPDSQDAADPNAPDSQRPDSTTDRSDKPQSGPGVVRGEILGPEQ